MVPHYIGDGHVGSTGVLACLGGGDAEEGEGASEGGAIGAGRACDAVGSASSDDVIVRIQPHHLQESGGGKVGHTINNTLQ